MKLSAAMDLRCGLVPAESTNQVVVTAGTSPKRSTALPCLLSVAASCFLRRDKLERKDVLQFRRS